jgi:hypothetical protein
VHAITGMEEDCQSASGDHGGGYLLGDEAGLAHSRDHDFARASEYHFNRTGILLIQGLADLDQCINLHLENPVYLLVNVHDLTSIEL